MMLVLNLLFAFTLHALECDCSQHIGTCAASSSLQGEILTIRTNVNQCAHVIYDVNGTVGSMTVTDGEGWTNFLKMAPGRHYQVSVQSCVVCQTSGPSTEPPPPPQVQTPPDYIPALHMTRTQAAAKLQAMNDLCEQQYPCGVGDTFTGDNNACVMHKRSCYADCGYFGNMFGYPGDLIQQICH